MAQKAGTQSSSLFIIKYAIAPAAYRQFGWRQIYKHHIRTKPYLCFSLNGEERATATANRKQQKALLSLLRELRTEAGIRQVDMARELGKPQAFVSYYESGARRLVLLELRQVSNALGISLPDFVREFEKRLQ
jgi:hypothetical protein